MLCVDHSERRHYPTCAGSISRTNVMSFDRTRPAFAARTLGREFPLSRIAGIEREAMAPLALRRVAFTETKTKESDAGRTGAMENAAGDRWPKSTLGIFQVPRSHAMLPDSMRGTK
jgi:hypothetical protein